MGTHVHSYVCRPKAVHVCSTSSPPPPPPPPCPQVCGARARDQGPLLAAISMGLPLLAVTSMTLALLASSMLCVHVPSPLAGCMAALLHDHIA
jgi:hypothetical protein